MTDLAEARETIQRVRVLAATYVPEIAERIVAVLDGPPKSHDEENPR